MIGDALLIAPGLHKQKDFEQLSKGEYPACAAMTTGYVFRVENEAMVHYMQRVGRPGQLTTLAVTAAAGQVSSDPIGVLLHIIYLLISLTISALVRSINDKVAAAGMSLLVLVNIANMSLAWFRSREGWKGQKEPGIKSDLLVLLSQDRWIRIQGMTDDVKVVTSGQWMRQPSAIQDLIYSLLSIIVYLSAGILFAATHQGRLLFLLLMLINTLMIEVANARNKRLLLYGRAIQMVGTRKAYERRLDMAAELVQEVGNDSWCEKLGMVLTKDSKDSKGSKTGPAHM